MGLDGEFVLAALLQYNYFPTQKEDKEELPPTISSCRLTVSVAEKLKDCQIRKGGYDQVEYRATRHTNVSRPLSIPHPLAYVKLSRSLANNWHKIKYITETDTSLIVPRKHEDGRIVIMNYESGREKIERHIRMSFTKKFVVHTDISNFFPSIYSHAIPWALVGFDVAKKKRNKDEWFNQIDYFQRVMKREETNGVPIGPASSNIVSEIILARIDERLTDSGFVFVRFIDDYMGYFDTYEQAEKFIRILSEELARYNLLLNIKKTLIDQLPSPSTPEWIVDLTTRMPDKDNLTLMKVVRYLDYAVSKQALTPDGSVLKYAAKSIIHDVNDGAAEIMTKYLLGLSAKYAILLPLLDILFEKMEFDTGFPYREQLINILREHAVYKRSDAMTWALYYLNKYSQPIPDDVARDIINTKDCISILSLYASGQHVDLVKQFCNTLDYNDLYQVDQYWVLLYQLYLDNVIEHPYSNEAAYSNHLASKKDTAKNAMNRELQVFDILKESGVSFMETCKKSET